MKNTFDLEMDIANKKFNYIVENAIGKYDVMMLEGGENDEKAFISEYFEKIKIAITEFIEKVKIAIQKKVSELKVKFAVKKLEMSAIFKLNAVKKVTNFAEEKEIINDYKKKLAIITKYRMKCISAKTNIEIDRALEACKIELNRLNEHQVDLFKDITYKLSKGNFNSITDLSSYNESHKLTEAFIDDSKRITISFMKDRKEKALIQYKKDTIKKFTSLLTKEYNKCCNLISKHKVAIIAIFSAVAAGAGVKKSGILDTIKESYDDDFDSFDDLYIEGANLEIRKVFKENNKAINDNLKEIQKLIKKDKDYKTAKVKIDETSKLLKKVKEDVLKIDSTTGSTILAWLFTGDIMFIGRELIYLLSPLAGLVIQVDTVIKRIKVLIEDEDISSKTATDKLNLYKNGILVRLNEYISALKVLKSRLAYFEEYDKDE